MFRYVALVWSPADAAASAKALRLSQRLQHDLPVWTCVLSRSGLAVFVAGTHRGSSRAYLLGDGVVLGTLFRFSDTIAGSFQLVLAPTECSAILKSAGRELIDAYWGRYVAFLYDASTCETLILRDPTGGMPCLWVESDGVRICCSWFEDCLRIEPRQYSVNWDTVTIRLAVALFHSEQSALNDVSELRPGECVRFRNGSHSKAFYWSPVEVANRDRLEDSSEATAALRSTTRMCIHAWASRYRGLVHYLSGGLDSAIVLAGLCSATVGTPVTALNYYAPGADGDERIFARAASARFGCRLVEEERNASVDLRGILSARRTVQPTSLYVRLEASQHEAQLASSTESDGIFSGDGGDTLFFRTPASLTAVDYVRDHGLCARALEVAFNAAYLEDTSLWSVLRDVWCYGVRRKRQHSLAEQRSDWGALTAEVAQSVARLGDFAHPWFAEREQLPPGKLSQAFLLSFAPDYYDPLGNDAQPEHACPLLSQPLVELCLRIPTYILAPGPQDRMLARNAFADDLPFEILRRPTKGGIARHVKQVLHENLDFLSDFLLDGVLVSRKLLDRNKLAAALSDVPTREKYWAPEIFEYVGIESWARNWV
jgi:asparagine synthase (glutamine-hydrolysing)